MLWVRVNPAVVSKTVVNHFELIFVVIRDLTCTTVSRLLWDVERADNLYTPNDCSSENPTRLNIPICIQARGFKKHLNSISWNVHFIELLVRFLVALTAQELRRHFTLVA